MTVFSSPHPPQIDALSFDGSYFELVDAYRAELLAKADELRRRVGSTQELGSALTQDTIALGRSIILNRLSVRNDMPTFPPIFLTFLEHPGWVGPTDRALTQFKLTLAGRAKALYQETLDRLRLQPMGGLFELNVFASLVRDIPSTAAQPNIAGTKKLADMSCVVDGQLVFVEATVLGEPATTARLSAQMRALGVRSWASSGPTSAASAHRIVRKIAEELAQTAEDVPNVLCVSFFDGEPMEMVRRDAVEDAWAGGAKYGVCADGSRLDLSRVNRVDSLFEFGRDRLRRVYVNPTCSPQNRLADSQRDIIEIALSKDPLMIR